MNRPIVHILNGEGLAGQLLSAELAGAYIVFNECLIDGPVAPTASLAFWAGRAVYIGRHFGVREADYAAKVLSEFDKLAEVPPHAELHFWFEHDLFCQANLWFLLAWLADRGHAGPVWRVSPVTPAGVDMWTGFGQADAALLRAALRMRVPIAAADLALGKSLWQAYARRDHAALLALAAQPSAAFQHLPEVCRAHVERFPEEGLGRPQRLLVALQQRFEGDFAQIFEEFRRVEGIYGFGDTQVQAMLAAL
jgi:hypothetical protein